MATMAAPAPSTHPPALQTARAALASWLDAERDQLPLWLPVAVGAGIATWFALPSQREWQVALLSGMSAALLALALGRGGRAGRALAVGAMAFTLGLALIWVKAERVRAPVLQRPVVVRLAARVEQVDRLPARGLVRLRLTDLQWRDRAPAERPRGIRVNVADRDVPEGLAPDARVSLRARLMPPPPPTVPGAYNFARVAWFDGIGATGRAFGPVTVLGGGSVGEPVRARLSRHIQSRVAGSGGGIAAALATGDTGGIHEADQEAMRGSGLAHLLSVSGLHITAAVGITMLLATRVLALNMRLAVSGRVPLLAAACGAAAALGYTWLTGSEVPTVRSCIAALLVLVAMAIGREALTLRLVATGALFVLLLWPETLAGPSFQLSFAAVTAIIALAEHPSVRAWFAPRDDGWARGFARGAGSLLLTGLVVEVALMPIAVFHFHKAGIYGALANIVAIPLTTFVIMPLEAIALLLDAVQLGAPIWWLVGRMLALLLWIAHVTASAPGATTALPLMPPTAFGLIVLGGLWIALWRTRWRRLGLVPVIIGTGWTLLLRAPDVLVTGDGRHVSVRLQDGRLALLRDRAGDYARSTLAEAGGADELPVALSEQTEAQCSRDLCRTSLRAGGREWRILATKSNYLVPIEDMIAACRAADIVISDRRLPRGCKPRWLRLDRQTLAWVGGAAITLSSGEVRTVFNPGDAHPWITAALQPRSPSRPKRVSDVRPSSPVRR